MLSFLAQENIMSVYRYRSSLMEVKSKKKPNYIKRTIWLSVLAGILLVITNSAVWVNNQIFDSNNFTNTAKSSLTSEESRNAIAKGISDRVFEGRPVLNNLVGDTSTSIISGLLGTNQAEQALSKVTLRFHTMVTSENSESITLELAGIKSVMNRLYDVSTDLGREPKVDPGRIPEQIVIVDANKLPNFYKESVILLWLAPLAFIGALISLAYPYFKQPRKYQSILAIQGAFVTAAALLSLSIGPLFRPPVLNNIQTESGRIVVGNLFDAFIATFNSQTMYLFIIGLSALLISALLYLYQKIVLNKK